MHITKIQNYNLQKNYFNNNQKKSNNKNPNIQYPQMMTQNAYYMPSFGYCDIHMRLMNTLNDKFANTINSVFNTRNNIINSILSNRENKTNKNNQAHKLAAQMIGQFANYQYSMDEVIPSYAIASSVQVAAALSKSQIFTNPVDIMLTINNLQNIETKDGIDKNTGRPYTDEQMRKSKANTQLYSTVIMLELLDKNLENSNLDEKTKLNLKDLRAMVIGSIEKIYGKDAYNRIQILKEMGLDASVEDKRKSLDLVKEFDEKAQELKFSSEFDEKLDELINYINKKENRTKEYNNNIKEIKIPVITLKYHTHPHEHSHNNTDVSEHEHNHYHTHEEMHEKGIEHTHQESDFNE